MNLPTLPTEAVRVLVPGKVNLSLRVGRPGRDGYHPLATVFQAVSLQETVVAAPGDGVTLKVTGEHVEHVPTDATNLAVRAALLLARHAGVDADVHLSVDKRIPVAGGMAGGSADAAGALVGCDELWRTGASREDLLGLAARLGADVPFALTGHTAVGTGRGDRLSPAMVRGEFHWVLAVADQGLSTPAVFAAFDELSPHAPALPDPDADVALMQALRAGDAAALGAALHNDLQPAALRLAPALERTLALLHDAGALGALVSGSGPTVAALARSATHAQALAAELTLAGPVDRVLTASGPVPGARVV